jgi:hypothetical protein
VRKNAAALVFPREWWIKTSLSIRRSANAASPLMTSEFSNPNDGILHVFPIFPHAEYSVARPKVLCGRSLTRRRLARQDKSRHEQINFLPSRRRQGVIFLQQLLSSHLKTPQEPSTKRYFNDQTQTTAVPFTSLDQPLVEPDAVPVRIDDLHALFDRNSTRALI